MQERIILKAIYGKQQGPLILCPAKDGTTGKLLGVKVLSPEEQRLSPRHVGPDTTRKISDNLELNIGENAVDAIDWPWIKECKEVAMSFEEAQSEPAALYYKYEPDKELDKTLEIADKEYQAMKLVKESSGERRRDLCRYLGMNVDGFRDKDVMEYLIGRVKAKNGPAALLKADEDPGFKEILFLFALLQKGALKKDKNGIIKYGDMIVGLNQEAAIGWLNESRNRDIVGKLYAKVYGDDSSNRSTSVINELDSLEKSDKDRAGKSGEAGKATNKKDKTAQNVAVALTESEQI